MSSSDDELDAELRRLFGDERLGVLPRAGAEEAVVSGAQRRRRRRAAVATTGGAVTVMVLITGGVVFGGIRSDEAAPPGADPQAASILSQSPTAPPPSTPGAGLPPNTGNSTAAPDTSRPPASGQPVPPSPGGASTRSGRLPIPAGPQLGPDGYRTLRLGMTFEQARATGALVEPVAPPVGCKTYQLKEGSGGVSGVTISAKTGVALFDATGAHTPEGVRVGSSEMDLKAAYPNGKTGANGYHVPAGRVGTYQFMVVNGVVAQMYLLHGAQDCVG